ncbi:MAG: hypothetical protein L6V93_14770 [Clostridiales bacterium]|nr:MAG: hypothetical protein L6V93_14770 [Clostridiales bacterium]
MRAYFAERDTKELKPVGIVDNFGHLTVFMQKFRLHRATVVFRHKNTITDKVDYVGYAYSGDEWTLDDEPAIDNAKKILSDIKNGGNCITPEIRKKISDEINEKFKGF